MSEPLDFLLNKLLADPSRNQNQGKLLIDRTRNLDQPLPFPLTDPRLPIPSTLPIQTQPTPSKQASNIQLTLQKKKSYISHSFKLPETYGPNQHPPATSHVHHAPSITFHLLKSNKTPSPNHSFSPLISSVPII